MIVQDTKAAVGIEPWWRQRWPWLLVAGPALAMVGCAITIVLAFEGFADQTIADGGVKRGLVVEKTTSAMRSEQSH